MSLPALEKQAARRIPPHPPRQSPQHYAEIAFVTSFLHFPSCFTSSCPIRDVNFRRTASRGFSCCRYQDKVPDTWPLRGLPLMDVTLPKAALWISEFGAPKLTVLSTLKNSPLRLKLRRSVIGNFFCSETSQSFNPKVRSESKYLGAFPNVKGAGE